jgi:hypothetical protein
MVDPFRILIYLILKLELRRGERVNILKQESGVRMIVVTSFQSEILISPTMGVRQIIRILTSTTGKLILAVAHRDMAHHYIWNKIR